MKTPSVVAALKSAPFEKLLVLGFAQHGGKEFRRVAHDVAQFVFVHVETRSHREFAIEYSSILLWVPQDRASLAHGGRFPIGAAGRWYRAEPDERLAQSVEKVAADLDPLVRWFEASATLRGFLETYREHVQRQPPLNVTNGHTPFTFACGYAAAGDLAAARVHAEKAKAELQAIHASFVAQFPRETHWAPAYIERCAELLDAVDRQDVAPLLAKWRNHTSTALEL